MQCERLTKVILIFAHVFIVLPDGTEQGGMQISLPGASEWYWAAVNYTRREIEINNKLMHEAALELQQGGLPSDTPSTRPPPTSPPITKPPVIEIFSDDDEVIFKSGDCQLSRQSLTEVGGKKVCRGQVIFLDHFSNGSIDHDKWIHDEFMPWDNIYSFVTYNRNANNSFLKNGKLFIKPTPILDEKYLRQGSINLENCTAVNQKEEEWCKRTAGSFNILPPVESARLGTAASFKYGKVEIRAKLPVGDWLFTEISLEPKDKRRYRDVSGTIQLVISRGNKELNHDGHEIGNNLLQFGLAIGGNSRSRPLRLPNGEEWGKNFHTFTLIWRPDDIMFRVDDNSPESIVPKGGQLFRMLHITDTTGKLSRGSDLAPFDEEFQIKFGVTAGGLTQKAFPDMSINRAPPPLGAKTKIEIWGNDDTKAMLRFWQKMSEWRSTWNGDDAALQVDYVKITAL